MPWVRLEDVFAQHPKMQQVGPLGLALHVAALCYCNQYLTDGFVPQAVVPKLQRFDNIDLLDDDEHATRMSYWHVVYMLADAGLWEEVDGGWRIHDFDQYQPTKEQVLADRERNRERQSKHRKSQRDKRVTDSDSHGSVTAPRTRTEVLRTSVRGAAAKKGAAPLEHQEPDPNAGDRLREIQQRLNG